MRTESLFAALSALIAGMAVTVTLRLWSAHLNVPLANGGDVSLNLMFLRNMQTTGWALHSQLVGAPFGQDLSPWPAVVGDTWHLVVLKLLSLVLSPAGALNIFFILTFPVVAAFTYLALRGLTVSRTLSVPLAVTYAILPFHFLRGESHVFLSSYFMVPVATLVAYWIYTGTTDVARHPRHYSWHEWCTLAMAFVLLGTGLYYAVFGLVLILAAALLRTIATRSPRPFITATVISAIVGAGIAASALPTLLFHGAPGAGDAVAGRTYGATEYFGLKIVNLLLPPAYHRVPALAHLKSLTSDSLIPGEGTEALGILGVIGLAIIAAALLAPRPGADPEPSKKLRALGAFAVISVVSATVAGLNGVLAVFGLSQLRAWDRMSVYIAFVAIAGLGIALDSVARAARARWHWARAPLTAGVTAVVILAIAVFDQTSPALTPAYAQITAGWDADEVYFQRAEQVFGPGSTIFELPYVSFPEGGTVGSMPYNDHLRGYVHSDLAWSFGGVKGQHYDWQALALQDGVAAAIPKLIVAGFSGLYVNRTGYADGGAAVEGEIVSVVGPQTPLVNADGTLAIYDLRPYATKLRESGARLPTADSVLRPVQLQFGTGFYAPESADGKTWRWAQATAHATLVNPSDAKATIHVVGSVIVRGADASVTLTIGDAVHQLNVVDGVAEVDVVVTIPSGSSPLTLWTDGAATTRTGETRDLHQQVVGLAASTSG